MRPDEEFAPLSIIKKNLTDFNRCAYRVYKSPAEFVTVEAATALEAFRESGIDNPFRIQRETRFMDRLVEQGRFSDIEELIETGVIMEAPQQITGHQEPVPQAPRPESAAAADSSEPPVPAEPQAPEAAEPTAAAEQAAMPESEEPVPSAEAQDQPATPAAQEELSSDDVQELLGAQKEPDASTEAGPDESLSEGDVANLLKGEE